MVVVLVVINAGTSMEYRGERVEAKENQRRYLKIKIRWRQAI